MFYQAEHVREAERNRDQHGWAVIYDNSRAPMSFSFTYGLVDRALPCELVVFGPSPEINRSVLNVGIELMCEDRSTLIMDELRNPSFAIPALPCDHNIVKHLIGPFTSKRRPFRQLIWLDTKMRTPWDENFNSPIPQPVIAQTIPHRSRH